MLSVMKSRFLRALSKLRAKRAGWDQAGVVTLRLLAPRHIIITSITPAASAQIALPPTTSRTYPITINNLADTTNNTHRAIGQDSRPSGSASDVADGSNTSHDDNGSWPAPSSDGEAIMTDAPPLSDSTDAASSNKTWSVLPPDEPITFNGSYTVAQTDVDILQ